MEVPEHISCVECGGRAHLMSHPPPEEGFTAGDTVAFVCEDCGTRHDVVVEDDGDAPGSPRLP
jgi:plastocyanin